MSGLILLFVIGLWAWLALKLLRVVARALPFKNEQRRSFFVTLAYIPTLILPVADELLARPQFEYLCHKNTDIQIDEKNISGRTVKVELLETNALVGGTFIPITTSQFVLRDAESREELGKYRTYSAEGGLAARSTRLPSGGSSPWTFGTSGCARHRDLPALAKQLNFTVIY